MVTVEDHEVRAFFLSTLPNHSKKPLIVAAFKNRGQRQKSYKYNGPKGSQKLQRCRSALDTLIRFDYQVVDALS